VMISRSSRRSLLRSSNFRRPPAAICAGGRFPFPRRAPRRRGFLLAVVIAVMLGHGLGEKSVTAVPEVRMCARVRVGACVRMCVCAYRWLGA